MDQHITAIILLVALLVWTLLALQSGNVPELVWLWFKNPEHAAKALRWGIRVAALLFAGVTWIAKPNSELAGFRTEATGIAIAVVVIEEVSRWRAHLEYKQSIIRQMGSQSNDFALDAARIAFDKRWITDGSLQSAWLFQANLQKAYLMQAKLQGAFLRLANFNNAHMALANLQKSDLSFATMQGTNLLHANLQDAIFIGVDLKGAYLKDANLQGAWLLQVDFEGADLGNANLTGSYYNNHTKWPDGFVPPSVSTNIDTLAGAHLVNANLQDAQFDYIDLQGADLRNANLQGANLRNSNLQGANLQGANLQGSLLVATNLLEASLKLTNLKEARYNSKTIWPDGFTPPYDAINVDEQPR